MSRLHPRIPVASRFVETRAPTHFKDLELAMKAKEPVRNPKHKLKVVEVAKASTDSGNSKAAQILKTAPYSLNDAELSQLRVGRLSMRGSPSSDTSRCSNLSETSCRSNNSDICHTQTAQGCSSKASRRH